MVSLVLKSALLFSGFGPLLIIRTLADDPNFYHLLGVYFRLFTEVFLV